MQPILLSFERTVSASAEVVWRALANTDAFNRTAGLGFAFEDVPRPDGGIERRGRVHRFGLTLTWSEEPFRFVAPDRFSSRRRFDSGPVASVETRFRLAESNAGTTVFYDVELLPRHWLLRPVVLAEARVSTSPQLVRALDAVVTALGEDTPGFDPPPPLDAAGQERLAARLADLSDAAVAEALDRLIGSAPLVVQDRLRPLRVAAQTGRPLDVVVGAFLEAVASEALDVRLLLLCPSCLGAKEELASLDPGGRTLHCGTCGISWEGSLSDLVEVAFRPAPTVRAFQVPVDCVQSPSRTPHVRAQIPLPVGETLSQRVTLGPGCYRVEATGCRGPAHLEVVRGGPDRATFDITDAGMAPRRVEVGEGPVELLVRGRVARDVLITVSERWRPPHALTLGAFLDHPGGARWALSHPDLELTALDGVVLAVFTEPSWSPVADRGLVEGLRRVLVEKGFDPVEEANGRLLAFTRSVEGALEAAEAVSGHGRVVGFAIGRAAQIRRPSGPAGGTALVGPAVDAALASARQVGWGRVAVDAATGDSDRLARAIHALSPRVERIEGWGPRPTLLHFAVPASSPPPRGARPTGRIGPYELGEPLGEGAMGIVFRATHATSGDPVVIKLLREELSLDYGYGAAFHTEARLGWTIQHPRVCRVLDWGLDPRHRKLYLAMDVLEGPTLAEHVKAKGPLDADALTRLAMDLLDALAAIHDAGVLHRDLKPSNVVMEAEGATLLDFGIALPLDARSAPRAGTPSWLSPEQARGEPLDERSDLYQLALLLCRAGTGHWPFPGASAAERHAWRDAHPLEHLPHGLPDGYEAVLLRALDRDRAQRPASARAFKAALASIV